jgi:hypothetical protein
MARRGAAILAVGALAPLAALLSSCTLGANDDPFNVTIKNNTSQTVVDHGYFVTRPGTSDGGGAVVLKPGQSFGEPEFANEGVGQDKISTLSGKTLGCLPFQFSENELGLRVNVTEMVRCHSWGNPPGNSNHDWPNRNY